MSVQNPSKRITAPDISSRKGGDPIVALTSYHAHTAAIADKYVDFILVGDSLGMVMHGFESTLPVPLDLMILHGRAVMRGARRALVVVDMPFGSYEESPAQAFRNASRLMAETGAAAVKLEGGQHMAETIAFLVGRGVPVMAHVGLTPQSVNTLGGYKVQGREADGVRVMLDAEAAAAAGAFSVVLEKVPEGLAARITQAVAIPTIGIRFWWWMICWGCSPRLSRSSSSGLASWGRRQMRRLRLMRMRCGRGSFQVRSTVLRMLRRRMRSLDPDLADGG